MSQRIHRAIHMRRTLAFYKGANLTAAAALALGAGNVFAVAGNTNINHIQVGRTQAGKILILKFSGTPTVAHNAGAVPSGYAAVILSGAANAVMAATSVLVLVYDGTNWVEIARRGTAASGAIAQSGTGTATGFTAGVGTAVLDDSTFTGAVGATAYRISDVVKALKNLGLLAA